MGLLGAGLRHVVVQGEVVLAPFFMEHEPVVVERTLDEEGLSGQQDEVVVKGRVGTVRAGNMGHSVGPHGDGGGGLYLLYVEIAGIGIADEVPRALVGIFALMLLQRHLHVVVAEELRLVGVLLGIDEEAVEVPVVVAVGRIVALSVSLLIVGNDAVEDVSPPSVQHTVGGQRYPCIVLLALGTLLSIVAVDSQGCVGEEAANVAHPHIEGEADKLPAVFVKTQVDGDVVGAHRSVVDNRGVAGQLSVAIGHRPACKAVVERSESACREGGRPLDGERTQSGYRSHVAAPEAI